MQPEAEPEADHDVVESYELLQNRKFMVQLILALAQHDNSKSKALPDRGLDNQILSQKRSWDTFVVRDQRKCTGTQHKLQATPQHFFHIIAISHFQDG